jgi:hypothetical protein
MSLPLAESIYLIKTAFRFADGGIVAEIALQIWFFVAHSSFVEIILILFPRTVICAIASVLSLRQIAAALDSLGFLADTWSLWNVSK